MAGRHHAPLLACALALTAAGCALFEEPELHDTVDHDHHSDEDARPEPIDCLAEVPDAAAEVKLPGPCQRLSDDDLDGEVDDIRTYEYDDAGRLTDERMFGTLSHYEYDDAGNRVLYETDLLIPTRMVYTYECFDEEDAPEPLPGPCTTSTDFNLDGSIDWFSEYAYEDGRLINERNLVGSRTLSLVTHLYDDAGLRESTATDHGGDGTIDTFERYDYDDAGHLTLHTVDQGNDGTIERGVRYEYDAEGRRLSEIRFGATSATAEHRIDREYDAEDRVIRETTNSIQPGSQTAVERRYDPAGNLLLEFVDHLETDGDECIHYDYGCFE